MKEFELLRAEAEAWFAGRGARGGERLYREIERVVALRFVKRTRLPDMDDAAARLALPAGWGPDPFSPQAAWDLLHDFTLDCLLAPDEPQVFLAFQMANDLGQFRFWLRKLLGRYISRRIGANPAAGLVDNLVRGLGRRFQDEGLVPFGAGFSSRGWVRPSLDAAAMARVSTRLSSESRMAQTFGTIADRVRPLPAADAKRLTSGYGKTDRDLMAQAVVSCSTIDDEDSRSVTWILEHDLKEHLTGLVEAQFPELFTGPLYETPDTREESNEGSREVRGVPHADPAASCGAVEAVLDVMERLTCDAEPAPSNQVSGADIRRLMRLYFEGATSTRQAKARWEAAPNETIGDRQLTLENAIACFPTGASALTPSAVCRRLAELLRALAGQRRESKPRSHVTIARMLERFWDVWSGATRELGDAALGDASRWLIDLLFLEAGRDGPDVGADDADYATVDSIAAQKACDRAMSALRRKSSTERFRQLLPAACMLRSGMPTQLVGDALGIPEPEVASLRIVYQDLVERAWERCGLLPGQRPCAERLLTSLLGEEQAGRERERP